MTFDLVKYFSAILMVPSQWGL